MQTSIPVMIRPSLANYRQEDRVAVTQENYFYYFCYGVDQRLDIYFQAQAQEILGQSAHHKLQYNVHH